MIVVHGIEHTFCDLVPLIVNFVRDGFIKFMWRAQWGRHI